MNVEYSLNGSVNNVENLKYFRRAAWLPFLNLLTMQHDLVTAFKTKIIEKI